MSKSYIFMADAEKISRLIINKIVEIGLLDQVDWGGGGYISLNSRWTSHTRQSEGLQECPRHYIIMIMAGYSTIAIHTSADQLVYNQLVTFMIHVHGVDHIFVEVKSDVDL